MKESGIEDWTTTQRRRKISMAHRMVTTEQDKWSANTLNWDPTSFTAKAQRLPQRPKRRWTDGIAQVVNSIFGHTNWESVASDKKQWAQTEQAFINQYYEDF